VDVGPLEPLPREVAGVSMAVNLHGRGPQSHRVLLCARPGRVVAFRNERVPQIDGPEWRAGEHEVQRWCRLLRESGIPADPGRLGIDPPASRAPAAAAGATLIHPGAAAAGRRWPADRWAEVARRELAAGRRVVMTGSAPERPLAEAVARAAGLGAEAVLAGRTDVVGLAAAVGAAARVACGDTGVAHLATALGRPSVVLFGPTPPGEWGPPPERARHRALWTGGRGDPHAGSTDPGLLAITPDAVAGELSALDALSGSRA
jgi:ADP-heptose:LPS heptosyltransferase